jgi:SAM-dependent methyltransferase
LYRLKLALLRSPMGSYAWRYWHAWRGRSIGSYADIPGYVERFANGKSFADIGCMWGVNGRYAFMAEDAGAHTVKGVDAFGPTPEFTREAERRQSIVEFILGDVCNEETLAKIGTVDVVLCAGVLYHHPNPYEMLVALRRICRETLVLRTFAIPENRSLRNNAVFFPYLNEKQRRLWNLERQGLPMQLGISTPFAPEEGYGNYFWGMTPSCLRSLVRLAGFSIVSQAQEPFAQTFVCSSVRDPFGHRMPGDEEARKMAADISARDIAKPA